MRTLLRSLVLASSLMAACRPDPASVCADCGAPPGGAVTEPTAPVAPPGQVADVKAKRVARGVRLTWSAVDGAEGFKIYRQEAAVPGAPLASHRSAPVRAAARVPGIRIGGAIAAEFLDTSVDPGRDYTYRVTALNDAGEGPASDPVKIRVVAPDLDAWVLSWQLAPADGGAGSGGVDWSSAPGTAGGDAGVTTTTSFPDVAAEFAGCTWWGAGTVALRPSLDDVVPAGLQTFSLTFAYDTAGEDWAYAIEWLTEGGAPVFHEEGALNGCGTETAAFTVDTAALGAGALEVRVRVENAGGWLEYYDAASYVLEGGSWVRVSGTQPAVETLLTNAGTLRVSLAYANAATQQVRLSLEPLDGWGPAFGGAVTQISGTGAAVVDLPYDPICGFARAYLDVSAEPTVLGGRHAYPVTSTAAYQLVASPDAVWARKGAGSRYGAVFPYACAGSQNVVLTAPPGWQVGVYDPYYGSSWGQTAFGPATAEFEFRVPSTTLAARAHGTYPAAITATFQGGAVTDAVTLNLYQYFWQYPPPPTAQSGQTYALAVTAVGPRPADVILIDNGGDGARLWWNGAAFAGPATYDSCVPAENFATDGYGYAWAPLAGTYWDNPFATEVANPARYEMWLDDWVYFDAVSFIGPAEIPVYDLCGHDFTWQIASAPGWVRFEALTGDQDTPIRAALAADDAFPEGGSSYYASGYIRVAVPATGEVLLVEVVAWR